MRRRGKVDRRKRDFTGIQFPETAHHTDCGDEIPLIQLHLEAQSRKMTSNVFSGCLYG